MQEFAVYLEARNPDGVGFEDPYLIGDITEYLDGSGGVLSGAPGYSDLSCQLTLEARDAGEAAETAADVWRSVEDKFGLHWPIVRLEIVTGDVFDQDLDKPLHPELWGVAEVAEHLDVSKQRVAQIRSDLDFPAPHVQLAAGPVWLADRVRQWEETWNRSPGRPRGDADGGSDGGSGKSRSRTVNKSVRTGRVVTSRGTRKARVRTSSRPPRRPAKGS